MRINVTRSSMPDFEEFCQEIRPLWDSHWLTNNGEKLLELQSRLEAYLDVGHSRCSPTATWRWRRFWRPWTCGARLSPRPSPLPPPRTPSCARGLRPCSVAILPATDYTLDPKLLEGLITERTCAILPVHVYGCLCDTDAIQTIADRHGLKVIYDAAHAFGVSRGGVSAARLGLASTVQLPRHEGLSHHRGRGGRYGERGAV